MNRSKMIKAVLGAAGALVITAAAYAAYVAIDGIPRYEARPPQLNVDVTPGRVARGKQLAELLCAGCHADERTGKLVGKHMTDGPPQFGDVWSKNITQSKDAGIGRWSDGDLAYLLRTGIRPDGQYVPPWMVKLPHISDEDLASIIAYLRSDDPAVAASDAVPEGRSKPSFLAKLLTHLVLKPLPYPAEPIVAPPRSDRVAYGRYLVFALDCYSCHSADFVKVDPLVPEKSAGYLGGGNAMRDADGKEILTANLTPDDETGIGAWTEADFVRALRSGFRPDGQALRYPMLPAPQLDDDDARAIYAYLRTVPKLRHAVARRFETPAPSEPPGRRAYLRYGCGGCHGADGTGTGSGADLRRANADYPTDRELREWIDDAPSRKPGTRMPAWKGIVREEDYAPLLAYVCSVSGAQGVSGDVAGSGYRN